MTSADRIFFTIMMQSSFISIAFMHLRPECVVRNESLKHPRLEKTAHATVEIRRAHRWNVVVDEE